MPWKQKDYTGEKFGKLTAIRNTGVKSEKRNGYVWEFVCDCGETVFREPSIVKQSDKSGRVPCCSECGKNAARSVNVTHGDTNTWLYNRWVKIRKRCSSPDDKDYKKYGAVGIKVSDEFLDFKVFKDYVSNLENYSQDMTVDRIDSSKGYERGNIRWVSAEDQQRNRQFKPKNNGLSVGVTYRKNGFYRAQWRGLDGKKKERSFSVKYYGEEFAKFLAEEYRELMIQQLRDLGVNYSEYHGKFKEVINEPTT